MIASYLDIYGFLKMETSTIICKAYNNGPNYPHKYLFAVN